LGLVEEEEGMDFVVEEAEGLVRVVCPNAQPDIMQRATAAVRTERTSARRARYIWGGRLRKLPITLFR
jgi:hypothetical protein